MRRWIAAALFVTLAGCGSASSGGSRQEATAHFAETVRAAYNQAERNRSADSWETFAITVQNTPAGADAVQRGLLVAAAHHASDSYRARQEAISCTVTSAACPSPGVDDPDRWMQRIAELVRGL